MTAVACAYCAFDDRCSAEGILRSFIHQLLVQRPALLPLAQEVYNEYRLQRTDPPFARVVGLLHSLVDSLGGTYIVVDGLDEIGGEKEKALLLDELKKLSARVLIFSRPLALHLKYLPSANIVTVHALDDDIERFVVSSLLHHPSSQASINGEGGLVHDVAVRIRERSRGV